MRKIIFFIVLIGGLVLTGCRQTKKLQLVPMKEK